MEVEDGIRLRTSLFFGPDGHAYHFNKVMRGGRLSFRCSQYKRGGCLGRCSVNDVGGRFRQTTTHGRHVPGHVVRSARQLRTAILERCRNGDPSPFQVIYHEERRRLRTPPEALANVTLKSLRPSMRRARLHNLPPVPHTLQELHDILSNPQYAHLTAAFNADDSIYAGTFGNAHEGTNCSIFISRRMRRYMRRVRKVFSDATFSVVPAEIGVFQCWNIVTLRRHHIIPLVRCLMQSKTHAAYVVALQSIQQLVPNFNPQRVLCDFEMGQKNAWVFVFNPPHINGCYFHSTKDISLKARELGLANLIVENEDAASIVRSACALALLPNEQLEDGFLALVDRASDEGLWDVLEEFFQYMLRTWIRKGRFFTVNGCEDRTSNACESDNMSLQAALKVDHPNVFQFLGVLVLMEEKAFSDLAVLDRGGTLTRRKSSAIANDRHIAAFLEDLAEGNIDFCTFLRRASRRIQNVHYDALQVVEEDPEQQHEEEEEEDEDDEEDEEEDVQ